MLEETLNLLKKKKGKLYDGGYQRAPFGTAPLLEISDLGKSNNICSHIPLSGRL